MNVVFLSPHFPPNWFNFAVRLRQAGATVLGIADAPWEALRPELRDALNDYYWLDDLNRYPDLVRALGWFTHRHGKLDRLDSLNEHWLETEARLRTDFNIRGIGLRDIARIRRKSRMKRIFQRAGLPVARGKVCRTPRQLRALIGEVGFPVVAKPDAGVGAARTYKLESDADVEGYLHEKLAVDYIVEEFVAGDLLTYDGLVDRSGEVVFGSSFFYSTGVMDSVNLGTDIYYVITRSVPPDVEAAGRAIVRAFNVRERPFHFEFFRLPDGSLVPLEVNMRPPGGLTVDMFNYANDIDFYREWANVVVHGTFEADVTRSYHCGYASRKNGRAYRLSHNAVVERFGDLICHHEPMSGVFASAIGDYGYIMRHPELDPIVYACQAIQETV
ncbi:MAG: ATP-grasp domain-containing protein [Candidatus Limnocylindria bacterium]